MTDPLDDIPPDTAALIRHLWLVQAKRLAAQRRFEKLRAAEQDTISTLRSRTANQSIGQSAAEHVLEHTPHNRQRVLAAIGWHYRPNHPDEPLRPSGGRPGVYLLQDDTGAVLYVGQSKRMNERLRQHRRDHRIPFTSHTLIPISDPDERGDLEAVLIAQHRPPFNRVTPRRTA